MTKFIGDGSLFIAGTKQVLIIEFVFKKSFSAAEAPMNYEPSTMS